MCVGGWCCQQLEEEMSSEKARKQRLPPLPRILQGPVAPHPDLLGQLGGPGCWASL